MIEEPIDTRGDGRDSGRASDSRARRLFAGWSANLVQMILGITQQVALVPVFLHFWNSDCWLRGLSIYAAGNLVLIADSGLQFRAINRFLAFKSSVDCDGRTADFYARCCGFIWDSVSALVVLLLAGIWLFPPSAVLGFQAVANFDAAFAVMTVGMLLVVPSNLVSGLYRARGLYGRAFGCRTGACSARSSLNWSRLSRPEACSPSPSPMWRRRY